MGGVHLSTGRIKTHGLVTVQAARIFKEERLPAAAGKIFHGLFRGQKPGVCNLVMHLPDLLLNLIKMLQQTSLHKAL